MQDSTRTAIEATFHASNEGSIHFGQVVAQLMAQQVESYHVDYRTGRATYYLPQGDTLDLHFEAPATTIAQAFDTQGVRNAIAGAQQGRVMYPEFKRLSQEAGCIGYTVWLAGRHVTYYGHQGETHVERFPD